MLNYQHDKCWKKALEKVLENKPENNVKKRILRKNVVMVTKEKPILKGILTFFN
jgi:hypothetical protein